MVATCMEDPGFRFRFEIADIEVWTDAEMRDVVRDLVAAARQVGYLVRARRTTPRRRRMCLEVRVYRVPRPYRRGDQQ